MKNLILLIISTNFLLACNQNTQKKEMQSTKNEQLNLVFDQTVSLSVEPNAFQLNEIPDSVTVTITNNTHDTIITGLQYAIEKLEDNEWKEVSPKDLAFNDLGRELIPNHKGSFVKNLYKKQINYTTGKYHIVKYYIKSNYQKKREQLESYGEFEIKE